MNSRELMRALGKGLIEPIYLLFGEERYFAKQIEKALIDAALPPEDRDVGLQIYEQDPSVPELVQAIESAPFFGGKNVIIVRDTKLFRASKGDASQDSADKSDVKLSECLQNMPDYTHLLFLAGDKVDKRRKLYKVIEKVGQVVELSPLKPREAREWVQEKVKEAGKSIALDALNHLMTGISFMSQVSIGFLDNETAKILLHAGDRQQIILSDVEATLAGVPEINIFAMIDAMSQKNISLALRLLDEQLSTGEPVMRMLMLIARQTRALLMSKELSEQGKSSQEIAKTLGLHPFIAEKMLVQARSFSNSKLKKTLIMISDVDQAIKSGRAGNVSLEEILIEMCR